jgi:hypothetical protein
VSKFATSFVDTGGKFATGVVDLTPVENLPPVSLTEWCTLTYKYLHRFSKKFEMTLMLFSGAGGI